jgi:hypothetical protein
MPMRTLPPAELFDRASPHDARAALRAVAAAGAAASAELAVSREALSQLRSLLPPGTDGLARTRKGLWAQQSPAGGVSAFGAGPFSPSPSSVLLCRGAFETPPSGGPTAALAKARLQAAAAHRIAASTPGLAAALSF